MNRNAIVFGSTGLVGSNLVRLLDENKNYAEINAYSRNAQSSTQFKKLKFIQLQKDFTIESDIDDVFICLGTTMKKAGSKSAFRAVDYEMVVEVAQKAHAAGVKRLIVISSIGANPQSRNFYLRTKGEMEETIKLLKFELIAFVRPSLLLGKRKEFRFGENLGIWLYRIFRFIFVGPLKKYRGIEAEDVAKAMVQLALTTKGTITVESEVLKQIADVYKS